MVILFVRFLAVEVQTCFDKVKAYTSLLLDILPCFLCLDSLRDSGFERELDSKGL